MTLVKGIRSLNGLVIKRIQDADHLLGSWLIDSLSVPWILTRYVHSDVVNVLKLFVAKEKIMKNCRHHKYSTYSNQEVKQFINKTLDKPGYKRDFLLMLERMARKGLLKVLLTVYLKLLPSFVKKGQEDLSKEESLKVFKFIASLATSKKWDAKDVRFEGDLLCFVLVPVAVRYGDILNVYDKRMEMYCQDRRIAAIFVVAIGVLNGFVAGKVAESFHHRHLEEFSIRIKKCYNVLTCQGNKAQGTTIFLSRTHDSGKPEY